MHTHGKVHVNMDYYDIYSDYATLKNDVPCWLFIAIKAMIDCYSQNKS